MYQISLLLSDKAYPHQRKANSRGEVGERPTGN